MRQSLEAEWYCLCCRRDVCVCAVHLKSHMVAHEERRFACPSCSYRAARKANLESHILAQHGSNRKSYRCSDPCQYSTGYQANLRKHQRLFCKNRQQTSSSSSNSASHCAAINTSIASGNMLPESEDETETRRSSFVPGISSAGISSAMGTVASSWQDCSGTAENSFYITSSHSAAI